jgi:hypothetical protein
LNVSNSTDAGTYSIVVTASGGGITRTTGFDLTVSSASPSVSVNKTSYTSGETITVTVNGGTSNVQEWIALYVASNPDSAWSFGGNWQYLNGQQVTPTVAVPYPVTLRFIAPSTSSTYNVRYFANNGYANRLATSQSFAVTTPPVTTPTMTPNGGSFTGSVSVSIQSATSGASIYYTTDGSTPTQSAKLYSGAINLTSSAVVTAKAFKNGYNASSLASASFTVNNSRGKTYYVAKTGSNSYSCTQAQSPTTAKLTIAAGRACLSAGDTLVIESGTYVENIPANGIPSGSSSGRTRIIGNTGAKWTIRVNTGGCNNGSIITFYNLAWVELSDVIVDATNCDHGILLADSSTDNYLHHLEVKNAGKLANSNGSGITFDSGTNPLAHRNRVSYVWIHDSGLDGLDHCTYVTGNDNIVEHSTLERCSGMGVHVYNSTANTNNRNKVRWNDVRNNGSFGIGIYQGDDNQVYGNLVTANGVRILGGGIRGRYTDRTKIYNNTIYLNNGSCILIDDPSANDTEIKNNVCVDNSSNVMTSLGTGTVISNNRLTSDGTVFVDVATRNFFPRQGSVLIGTGTSVGLPSDFSFFGSAPDQGAFQLVK